MKRRGLLNKHFRSERKAHLLFFPYLLICIIENIFYMDRHGVPAFSLGELKRALMKNNKLKTVCSDIFFVHVIDMEMYSKDTQAYILAQLLCIPCISTG